MKKKTLRVLSKSLKMADVAKLINLSLNPKKYKCKICRVEKERMRKIFYHIKFKHGFDDIEEFNRNELKACLVKQIEVLYDQMPTKNRPQIPNLLSERRSFFKYLPPELIL